MRYAQKLICLLLLVLSASFGIGGCYLLYSDFGVQLERIDRTNAAAHAQTCTLLQTEIIDLQRRSKTEQEFESLGRAIVDLFELIFGAENTQKIVSFYEGDYANMLMDLFPYLRNTVFEELNRRTAARIKNLKKQYR